MSIERAIDNHFVREVRRYRPSGLIALISRYSTSNWRREQFVKNPRFAPWVLAEIVRVSLLYGTEYNRASPSMQDLARCVTAYHDSREGELEGGERVEISTGVWARRVTPGPFFRMASEQMRYQHNPFNDMARTPAILYESEPRKALKVLTGNWEQDMFGGTLVEYMNAGQVLLNAVEAAGGELDLEWIQKNSPAAVTRRMSVEALRRVVASNYARPYADYRMFERSLPRRAPFEPYAFNPLHDRPVISEIQGTAYIPVPGMVIEKMSPLGVYYRGVEVFGNAFAEDLGELFEVYVGRQLQQLPNAIIFSEIEYGSKKRRERSVDWIVVFEELVLLVEAKSRRINQAIREGSPEAIVSMRAALLDGLQQLERSAELIRGGAQEFREIPSDRPIYGMLVTMEPFHNSSAALNAEGGSIEKLICSARNLEELVSVSGASVPDVLQKHFALPLSYEAGRLNETLVTYKSSGENSVLQSAFALCNDHGATGAMKRSPH